MLSSNLFRLAKVGRAVRDQLMGLEPQDVDFVSVPQVEFATIEKNLKTCTTSQDVDFVSVPQVEFATIEKNLKTCTTSSDYGTVNKTD